MGELKLSRPLGADLGARPTKQDRRRIEDLRRSETPVDRRTDVDDDVRQAGNDVSRAADQAGDKVGDAAEKTKDGAASVGHKISDGVEDMIPGDSDQDGH